MREIKFRAWNKRTNQFGRPATLREALKFAHNNPEAIEELDYLKIMQYTGLKGKNGKEVYEGDIVKYQISDTQHSVGEVKWSPVYVGFYFDGEYKGRVDPYYVALCEIIGNIYENPELLKEKS